MSVDINEIKNVYNAAASDYAVKYRKMGARKADIDAIFSLCDKDNPSVFEIGCAGGRDAEYIITKTSQYAGIDISEKFIELARGNLPGVTFVAADIRSSILPNDIDMVIAFASLLHLSKEELKMVLRKIHKSLNSAGLMFISLKRRDKYQKDVLEDEYGTRVFYYYDRVTIEGALKDLFLIEFYEEQDRTEDWISVIVRKL